MRRAALLALIGACGPTAARPVVQEEEYVGQDSQVDAATLVFTDDVERARFERVRACYAERGAAWAHYPLRQIGNFVEEDWCRAEDVPSGCSTGGFHDQPGVDWATVSVLYYPPDWPKVFASIAYAGHRPAEGWGGWVGISTNGQTVLGDGGSVGFGRSGDLESDFYCGTTTEWEVGETGFEVTAEGDGWALLDRVRASPQALRDETLAHWTALEEKVLAGLPAAVRCEWGVSHDGRPPPCTEVALTAAEIEGETERIRAKVASIRAAFDEHGDELYALLLSVAPVGCP